jgi:3-deoxy-D-manno-octulosonate 8-phosphate phosphatase (KDO 8-P phosphatase)
MQQHKLTKEQVLFMGDDMPDAPALRLVGLPCCPNDAALILKIAKYISSIQWWNWLC